MESKKGKRAVVIRVVIAVLIATLWLSSEYWTSAGHWWFGGTNYQVKLNDIPQSDYSIYRALNGDVLVICWDHMTEYYLSLREQKAWEINRRAEVSIDAHFLLYFQRSLTSNEVRSNSLKAIASPQFKLLNHAVEFTDASKQLVSIAF